MVGSSPEESGGHTCRLTTESKLEGNTTGGLSRTIPSGMHMNHKNDPHFPQFAGLSVTLGSPPAPLSLSLSLSHTHQRTIIIHGWQGDALQQCHTNHTPPQLGRPLTLVC